MITGLMEQLFKAPTGQARVRAGATLVMWFAMGAFVCSTANSFISHIPDGIASDIVGGVVGVSIGAFFKAV